jgi:sec-independent protein translocase protein TatB
MMPGVGFEEMILLVVVAIVVIGPKDLPLMMRKFGRFTGKMRAMAFEFKQGFEELGRQAELEELRKEVADLKKHTGIEDLRKEFEEDKRNLEADVRSAMADPPAPAPAATPQLQSPGEPAPGTEPPPAAAAAPAAAVAAAADAVNQLPPVRSEDKWPKPIKRTPTHPAAASAVTMARPVAATAAAAPAPEPAPYAGLSADHPGYDTGDDFRLEGHPPEAFAPSMEPVRAEDDPADDDGNVHIIPDEEVRPPAAPARSSAKQDTPA